jgi:hypothetical protein
VPIAEQGTDLREHQAYMRGTGGPNGMSGRPSASCGVLAPRPSTKRPLDIECSVAAAIAMVAALRPENTGRKKPW